MQDLLIVGNGISRLLHTDFIRRWSGELWACNQAYLEADLLPKITLLAGHSNIIEEARAYRDAHGLAFTVFGGLLGQHPVERDVTCPGEFRKDSGTTLVAQAHEDGYERIYLVGFDLGGPDIWSPRLHTFQRKHVWVRRWRALIDHYGTDRIRFVGFDHLPFLLGRASAETYMKRYTRAQPHIPDPAYIALHRLIYGSSGSVRGDSVVRVRFIKGEKVGFETNVNEAVALIMEQRGEVTILGAVSQKLVDETGEIEVTADTEITARMNKETLLKIAGLKGLDPEATEGLTNAELRELLQE